MLTLKQIEIYKSYKGNGDGFVRCASDEEKANMTYKQWSLIDEFIQDIYVVDQGLASKLFSERLDKKLQENCDSIETINQLKELRSP